MLCCRQYKKSMIGTPSWREISLFHQYHNLMNTWWNVLTNSPTMDKFSYQGSHCHSGTSSTPLRVVWVESFLVFVFSKERMHHKNNLLDFSNLVNTVGILLWMKNIILGTAKVVVFDSIFYVIKNFGSIY